MNLKEWLEDLEVPDTPLGKHLFALLDELVWFTESGILCLWEPFTFDLCFKLLLSCGLDHEEAMFWMLAKCDFSAFTWQERIHNKAYRKLKSDGFLSPDLASKIINYMTDEVSPN